MLLFKFATLVELNIALIFRQSNMADKNDNKGNDVVFSVIPKYASCKLLEAPQNRTEVQSCCSLNWIDLRIENCDIAPSCSSTNSFVVNENFLIHFFQLQFLYPSPISSVIWLHSELLTYPTYNSLNIFYQFSQSYQASYCFPSVAP